MRNRKTKEKYTPADGSWTQNKDDTGSSPDLNSEIENLFNTYTHQNNIAMGTYANPLLDAECTSDVTFLAGIEPEVWRIPGHRRVLADKNSVFQAMFFGPMARNRSGESVEITDVQGRAFDHFIKFLYNDDIEFQGVSSALEILHVADKYLCTGLIKKCVFYLDQHLSADNVLNVYCNVQIYTADQKTPGNDSAPTLAHLVPSAPSFDDVFGSSQQNQPVSGRRSSLKEKTAESRIKAQYKHILDLMQPGNDSPESINGILNMLCYNCLLFIDNHASQIFSNLQNVEDISSIHTLNNIFSRSTLQVSDEVTLYQFLNAYLTNTLKQLKIAISLTNKRHFLTNANCDRILFTIKYLRLANIEALLTYVHQSEKNNLFHPYEIDFLIYLQQNKSHLHMIAQNLSNTPLANNSRNASSTAESPRSASDTRLHSWENFNLDYINVVFLDEPRTETHEAYLPLSLRSLPKIKAQDEATGQEKIAACVRSKEKRKFAEYVWTVLAFIFD